MSAEAGDTNPTVERSIHRSLDVLRSDRLVAVVGGNFSGRTQVLRLASGLPGWSDDESPLQYKHSDEPMVYVGPEVYNVLSGLAPTVGGEVRLHTAGPIENSPVRDLMESLGLMVLLDRNPFTLSGGEQASLVISCALALSPEVLAIDCALEQLDSTLKTRILDALSSDQFSGTATMLADNRLRECPEVFHCVPVTSLYEAPRTWADRFGHLHPDELVPPPLNVASLGIASVSFGYSDRQEVLRSVTIELEPGGIYYLVGRNGAGKSTLAKLLSGVLRAKSGRFTLAGEQFEPWDQPGRTVAYHFQNPDLQLFATSVEREIRAGARGVSGPSNETMGREGRSSRRWVRSCQPDNNSVEATLRAFGLDNLKDEHPLDLPFACRKRVALAATLVTGAPWIILDEPTVGQDDQTVHDLVRIIRQLTRQGTGIIIITHSQGLREILPGKHLVLEDGELRYSPGENHAGSAKDGVESNLLGSAAAECGSCRPS